MKGETGFSSQVFSYTFFTKQQVEISESGAERNKTNSLVFPFHDLKINDNRLDFLIDVAWILSNK